MKNLHFVNALDLLSRLTNVRPGYSRSQGVFAPGCNSGTYLFIAKPNDPFEENMNDMELVQYSERPFLSSQRLTVN